MPPALLHQGKVRDVYDSDQGLILVATDRLSAFDVILPDPIPGKGIALTQMARFWFEALGPHFPFRHHVLAFDLPQELDRPEWRNRAMLCRKTRVIPLECVVRGYLSGSAWLDYQKTGAVQGHALPAGLKESAQLPKPLFTPTTKASAGHDEPLEEAEARKHVGDQAYETLRDYSLRLYCWAANFAYDRGIIIADTKFEFGCLDGETLLIDEILTPDSSRFWPVDGYAPGKGQPSFDKQYVRDYLNTLDWNKQPPGPPLPKDVIRNTAGKYAEAYRRLTGRDLPA